MMGGGQCSLYNFFLGGSKWEWGLSGKLYQFRRVGPFLELSRGVYLASLVMEGGGEVTPIDHTGVSSASTL